MKRVGELVASRNLDMSAWEDGVYGDDVPNPRGDFDSRSGHSCHLSECVCFGQPLCIPKRLRKHFDVKIEAFFKSIGSHGGKSFISVCENDKDVANGT